MKSHDIIMIAAEPWEHYTWRRRHHVAWSLAKSNRVLFVEPPLTVANPFRDIDLNWRHLLRLGKFKHQGRNLWSYSPVRLLPLFLPGAKRYNYYEWNRKRIFCRLKETVRKLKFKDPILWVYYNKYQYNYYGLFDEKLVVTDWYDKYGADLGNSMSKERLSDIASRENRLIENSNLVFTVSKKLKEELQRRGVNTHLVPHGVDYSAYETLEGGVARLQKIRHLKRPIIGYAGILNSKIDFNLIDMLARSMKRGSIILVGPLWLWNDEDKMLFSKLIKRNNVHYYGEIEKRQLPSYISNYDVCMMPMKRVEFNIYSAPLKIWEYLAAGKSIVCVDQGVRYDCSEFIEYASGKEEFIERIELCLIDKDNNEKAFERIRVAKENSWDVRVAQMMDIVESYLNDQNRINDN